MADTPQGLMQLGQSILNDQATPEQPAPTITMNSPVPGPIAASPKQLLSAKPLFFEEEGPNVTPPLQQSGTTTQNEVATTRVGVDVNQLGQNQQEATDKAGQMLEQGKQARQEGLADQRINLGVTQIGLEDELQGHLAEAEAQKKYIGKLEATKIDESDWWRDGGTGRTVGAMLALAAGGFVNAIRPGSNNVTEVIYGAIDRYVRNKQAEKRDELTRRIQLLGDEQQAIKALRVDIRKTVLDQGALMMQSGQVDEEFAKTMAKLYHDNVKDMNSLLMQAAPRQTVTEKQVQKPGGSAPWQQYGMDQKRWDRFTQGENKEPGAFDLVTQARSARDTLQKLKTLAAENGGVLPGYGPLSGAIPDSVKTFLARSGIEGVSNMTQARQAINGEILKFISSMNSRLVDSNQERARMEQIFTENGTPEIIGAVESMLDRTQQGLRDWAGQHAVPGVDPNDMVKYVAQTGARQREPEKGFQQLVPGNGGQGGGSGAPLQGIGEGEFGQGFISPNPNVMQPQSDIPTRRPPSGEEVPPQNTPVEPKDIKGALIEQLGGDTDAARLLFGQIMLETGNGKQMYGNNVGNIKATGDSKYQLLKTTEGYGDKAQKLREPFRAYDNLEEGIADYLALLRKRYPDAYEAALNGDAEGFNAALKKGGYYTDDPEKYGAAVKNRSAMWDTSG